MDSQENFAVFGVMMPAARWVRAGTRLSARALQARARRALDVGEIMRPAYACVMEMTDAIVTGLILTAAERSHGVASRWITPDGTVHDATAQTPRGHVGWVEQNAGYLGLDPARKPMEQANDLVTQKGWVRFYGLGAMMPASPTPEQMKATTAQFISAQAEMGMADGHQVFISFGDKTYHTTVAEVKAKGVEGVLAGFQRGAAIRMADTGGGGGGAEDQTDNFEKQNDFVSGVNDGSPGWAEKSLEYAPQDFTPEVWWARQLLDYLNKKYPGRTDVTQPQSDTAQSNEPPTAFGWSREHGVRRADAPQATPAAPAGAPGAFPQPPAALDGRPGFQEQPQGAPEAEIDPMTGQPKATQPENEEDGLDFAEMLPELTTFTAWDLAGRARMLREADSGEAAMISDKESVIWTPEVRLAVILNLKGVKWKEEYTAQSAKRPNFYRFRGKDKDKAEYVAHLIGDQPSERGLFSAAVMKKGEAAHSRYAFDSAESMVAFAKKFWGLKGPMEFEKLKAEGFLPKLWSSYEQNPRKELLAFILNTDADGAPEFVRKKFEDPATPSKARRAILDAYMNNPDLKGIPADVLNRAAIPILVTEVKDRADQDSAGRLINLPNTKPITMKMLADPDTSADAKKVLIQAIIADPEATSAPDKKEIRQYIKEFLPGEYERTEVPTLFEEKVELKTKDPALMKNMDRLIKAWEDTANKQTIKLKSLLQAGTASKDEIIEWMKAVQGYNPKLAEWAPNSTMEEMQGFIDLMKNNIATVQRYAPTGLRPFPFKVVVEYQDRGSFYVHLKISDVPPEIPREMVEQMSSIHHTNTIAWARVNSFALTAGKKGASVKVWAIDEMQSDIAQRTSQLGLTVEEQSKGYDVTTAEIEATDPNGTKVTIPAGTRLVPRSSVGAGNKMKVTPLKEPGTVYFVDYDTLEANSKEGRAPDRAPQNYPVEWGAHRSRLENWLQDWDKILLSLVLRRAKEHGVNQVWLETAESLSGIHWLSLMGKKDESGESTTKKMFEKLYDEAAKRWGAKEVKVDTSQLPDNIKRFKFWAIDVGGIPAGKLARPAGRVVIAESDEEYLKRDLDVYFKEFQKANEKITGEKAPAQEVFDFWYMTRVPDDKRWDEAYLRKAVDVVRALGHDIHLPSQVNDALRQREREEIGETLMDIQDLPEVGEDALIEAGRRMEAMPEGPQKEKARAKLERMRLELRHACHNGLFVRAWGSGGVTLDTVYKAWKEGKRKSRGNYSTDGNEMKVHGNTVLTGRPNDFWISDAGWTTQMTKGALVLPMQDFMPGWNLWSEKGHWILMAPMLMEEQESLAGAWEAGRYREVYKTRLQRSFVWPGKLHVVGGEPVVRGLKPASALMDEIRENRREDSKRQREKAKESEFFAERFDAMVMNAVGGQFTQQQGQMLLEAAIYFSSYGLSVKEEFEQVGNDPMKAAQFILSRKDTYGYKDFLKWAQRQFAQNMGMEPEQVLQPLGGILGEIRVAEIGDPSDTQPDKWQTDEVAKTPLDPQTILYRRQKGLGAPFGDSSGAGDGELHTSLPASARLRWMGRRAEGTLKFSDVFKDEAVRKDIVGLLTAGKDEAQQYMSESGSYEYFISFMGSDESRLANTLGLDADDNGEFGDGSDLEDALSDVCDGVLAEWELPGNLFGTWNDGELALAYTWEDSDLENLGDFPGVGAQQVKGPLEGEAAAITPWELVKSAKGAL